MPSGLSPAPQKPVDALLGGFRPANPGSQTTTVSVNPNPRPRRKPEQQMAGIATPTVSPHTTQLRSAP